MKYALEGSCGGYPLCEDKQWIRLWDYQMEHHDCTECYRKNVHESAMYHTSIGWMCIDCYNELETEIPEIL